MEVAFEFGAFVGVECRETLRDTVHADAPGGVSDKLHDGVYLAGGEGEDCEEAEAVVDDFGFLGGGVLGGVGGEPVPCGAVGGQEAAVAAGKVGGDGDDFFVASPREVDGPGPSHAVGVPVAAEGVERAHDRADLTAGCAVVPACDEVARLCAGVEPVDACAAVVLSVVVGGERVWAHRADVAARDGPRPSVGVERLDDVHCPTVAEVNVRVNGDDEARAGGHDPGVACGG